MKRLGIRSFVSAKNGFTLIELLMSVSIMAIILGITFSGGPQSIMKLSLSDNAYQIELMLREAQLRGSAINSVEDLFGGVGILFDRASSTQVLKFRDTVDPTIKRALGVGNGLFNASTTPEEEILFKTTNNHKIGKLCVATSTSPLMCNDDPLLTVHTLTVSFVRPKPIAHIYVNGTTSVDYTFACIQIDSYKSPEPGYVKSISVYKSGMITKATATCN